MYFYTMLRISDYNSILLWFECIIFQALFLFVIKSMTLTANHTNKIKSSRCNAWFDKKTPTVLEKEEEKNQLKFQHSILRQMSYSFNLVPFSRGANRGHDVWRGRNSPDETRSNYTALSQRSRGSSRGPVTLHRHAENWPCSICKLWEQI